MSDGVDSPGDDEGFRPPLPPEDRLWRHPSELRSTSSPPLVPSTGSRFRSAVGILGLLAIGSVAVAAAVLVAGQSLEVNDDTDTAARLAASTSAPRRLDDPTELLGLDGTDTAEGVMITACDRRGAADTAGLRAGDLLVSVGGVAVLRMEDMARLVTSRRRDGRLAIEVRRDGTLVEVDVQLEPAD